MSLFHFRTKEELLLTEIARTLKLFRLWGLPQDSQGTRPVQLTPGQLRSVIGLSVEAYRHWKRVLPPFVARKGYAPSFSLGDVLAASILRRLTERGGIRIGHLKKISSDLIRLCNTASWPALKGQLLVIDLHKGTCQIAKDQLGVTREDVIVLCPLDPVMAELRDALQHRQPSLGQGHLLFPLAEIGRASRMQGSRP
jgi:hypothetical protein